MATPPASDRARVVLSENKYMALATQDGSGPWAAALAFTLLAPRSLCFVSQTASRHGRAIEDNGAVAGVIFDSSAAAEDVESIQFSGQAAVVSDPDRIREVLTAGGGEADEAEVERIANNPAVALYEVQVSDAYVLDQAAWLERGIDAREPVEFEQATRSALGL